MSFKIGNLKLQNKLVLAPLAGITNLPFRLAAKKGGAGLVCSEMISSKGLLHKNGRTFRYLKSCKEEKPFSVQIFGSDENAMGMAAEIVEESGADVLDINFGCTVRKVVKTGSGVALMFDIKKAEKILKKVRNSIKIPFTIKIRKGDASGNQALEIVKMAEDVGVDAICLHGRTASQKFSGNVDLEIIKKVKKSVKIPVIGNGDVISYDDAFKMFKETNCDAIMIGRGAMSKPYIFDEINFMLENKSEYKISLSDHFKVIKNLFYSYFDYFDEIIACKIIKGRLFLLLKGYKNSKEFRKKLIDFKTKEELFNLIEIYEKSFF